MGPHTEPGQLHEFPQEGSRSLCWLRVSSSYRLSGKEGSSLGLRFTQTTFYAAHLAMASPGVFVRSECTVTNEQARLGPSRGKHAVWMLSNQRGLEAGNTISLMPMLAYQAQLALV